jgi:branched-chain amino acid transport system permease protein
VPVTGPVGARRALTAGRVGRVAALVVAVAVALGVADRFLPGHLPPGIVLKGVVLGGLEALVAMGLVLLYRSARIVNFAQGAIGLLGLTVVVSLISGAHLGYGPAVLSGIAVTALLGWLVGRIFERFATASRMVATVATIGLAELINAANVELPRLIDLRSSVTFTTPFSFSFTVRPLAFTGDALVALGAAVLVLAGLWFFSQRTETGLAIRAAADNRERALLLGIPVRRLAVVTWVLAASLAGIGAILAAPITGVSVGQPADPSTLLAPLAAAVLAGMESLPATVAWSVVLSVVDQAVFWSFHNEVYGQLVLFAVVVGAMLVRGATRPAVGEAWRTEPPSGASPAPALRQTRGTVGRGLGRALPVGLVGIAALVPLALPAPTVVAFQYVAIYAILGLSLVVLAGWAGQISLAQYALAGIGAAVTGAAMVHLHVPFLAAAVAAAAAGAVVALLLGVPALRIQGLNLAVVTMAFSVPASSWLLSPSFVPWLDPVAPSVPPPVLFGRFDLASPWTFYELCLGALVLCAVAVHNLRHSRAGRVVTAVRDNPQAAAAYGVSPLRARLLAFAVAGALAGVAGALLLVSTSGIPANGYSPSLSIDVFAVAVIGGLGSVAGAITGAVYAQGAVHFLPEVWQYVADGGGLLVLLLLLPEGLSALVGRVGAILDRVRLPARAAEDAAPRAAPALAADRAAPLSDAVSAAALRMAALEDLEVAEQFGGSTGAPDAGPEAGRPVLELEDVSVVFGAVRAVAGISLGVAQGEALAMVGTNGAGKSTTLRAAAGLVKPVTGKVVLVGRDVTGWSPAQRVEAGLVAMLGGRSTFPSLTVADNLRLGAWTVRHRTHDHDFARRATGRVLELFPALADRLDQPAGQLSGGERQLLALAQSLLCRPRVLLVDELSLGLAPAAAAQVVEVVRALVASGVTVVVVEQSVNVATALCERAVFVERGRVRFSGPTPDLAARPDLLRSVFLRAADRAVRRRAARPAIDVASLLAGVADTQTAAAASPPTEVVGVVGPEVGRQGELPAGTVLTVDDVAAVLAGWATPATVVGDPGECADGAGSAGDAGGLLAEVLDQVRWPATAGTGSRAAEVDGDGLGVAAFVVRHVSKAFGGLVALHDVSLAVAPGEILGVIGTNGAGKTTLFDVCSGFSRPDWGSVQLFGRDVTSWRAHERAALGLGRVFQDVRLWPNLTVAEALATALEREVAVRDPVAAALGLVAVADAEADVADRVDELLHQFGLVRSAHRPVRELSTGMRRVTELACAFAHRPRVLLLDEPTAGIAQREASALGELLLGLRDETGAAFVVIEHDVPLVASVADALACLHLGSVIAHGPTANVLEDPAVADAYLSGGEIIGAASRRARAAASSRRVGIPPSEPGAPRPGSSPARGGPGARRPAVVGAGSRG